MSFLRGRFTKKNIVKTFNGNDVLKFVKSDYDATYDIANAALRTVGIRLINNDSPRARLIRKAFFLLELANLIIPMILELIKMLETDGDDSLMNLFTMMPCVGYLILASVKSCKIFYNRPVYENLITELSEMWPQDAVTGEEYDIVRSGLTRLKRVVKGYMFCNVALFVMFSSPAIVCIVKRKMGYEMPLELSFSYWFPFDPLQHGRFEVIAAMQTWQCYITLIFISSSDVLFCVFLSHITTQFDLLAVRIKKLFHLPEDQQPIERYPAGKSTMNSIKNEPDVFYSNELEKSNISDLIQIINRHRALIRLSGDVENQFTFSLLINFINSSIIICFCGFCCVFVEKWNVMIYKIFLMTAALEIWMLCWYGQKLQDSSEEIANAVYSCGWYNAPRNIKSSLIIILYRAQNVVYITAYGFTVISMASFSTILKTSWSYLMLLVNVFKQ